MDASALIFIVLRMETLGHKPWDIYDALAKRVDPQLAWQVVRDVTGWGERPPKTGKTRRGVKHSPQSCANMAAGQKGKRHTPATCDKIATTLTGRSRPEETRKRIAAGRAKYWAARREQANAIRNKETTEP